MADHYASLKKDARFIGFLYLLFIVPGAFGLMYVPSHIMVDGNDVATARNMLAHEFLFRAGIVSQFVGNIIFVYLVFLLYRLLKQVNQHQARIMVGFVLVQVAIAFLNEVFNLAALMALKGEIMKTFAPAQKQDLAMLFINLHWYGTVTLEMFWGLWLLPFGQLVYRSGFIPKVFGVLLIIAGVTYITQSLTYFLFPDYHHLVSQYAGKICSIGETAIVFWLLIVGVRVPKVKPTLPEA